VGFLWFVVWLGLLAFGVAFLLTVVFGSSGRGAAAVAGVGLLAIVIWIGALIVAAPSEPVHESVKAFGRHVSPYLWFIAGLNLLGWVWRRSRRLGCPPDPRVGSRATLTQGSLTVVGESQPLAANATNPAGAA